LRGRDAAWRFEASDVLAHSDRVFANAEQARDDALSNTGGWTDNDAAAWDFWVQDSKHHDN
jgi:hypothetical protein